MSLKQFHIFFIVLSIITAFFFGTWLFVTVEAGGPVVRFFFGGVSYLVGIALVFYARYFLNKVRRFSAIP